MIQNNNHNNKKLYIITSWSKNYDMLMRKFNTQEKLCSWK